MSKVVNVTDSFIEEVKEGEIVEKVENVEKVDVEVEKKKDTLSFTETILRFLTKYLGCSNKRADVINSANKPVEMEINKNEETDTKKDDDDVAAAI